MKSILIAIQPYWVFLIIAKIMGWEIDQEKTVEVRKSFPKDLNWNKKSIIYCSKNKQSFNRIPKKYQPLMENFLGKVIGEFVCDRIYHIKNLDTKFTIDNDEKLTNNIALASCLDFVDMKKYLGNKDGYAWHITDLVIYDKPKELGELRTPCKMRERLCGICDYAVHGMDGDLIDCDTSLERPPQSWCYVEK